MVSDGFPAQNSHAGSPPWQLAFRSSKKFVVTVVAIAVFTDIFIFGMIIPILPTVLKTRVDVPDNELQKWMSVLLAAFGGGVLVGSPLFGYFSDKGQSRKLPFMLGLLALGGTTVMFWVGRTVTALVVARALQGLSGAVVWTVGLALVVDTAEKDEMGVSMGYVSMAMTVGIVSGPFIGGIVLSRAGYHAVFVVALGLILLDIILRLVMIEPKAASEWLSTHPDRETEGLIRGSDENGHGYYDAVGRDCPDETIVESCATREPVNENDEPESRKIGEFPGIIRLLFSGSLLVVLGAAVVNASIGTAFDTVLPVFTIKTFHWEAYQIGLCFLPLFAPSFLATIVGKFVDRYGAWTVTFLGFLVDCPVFLLFQVVRRNTVEDKVVLCVLLLLAGVASILQNVALMVMVNEVAEQVERDYPGIFGEQGGTGRAYGLYNVAWSGGQVVGPLVAGSLAELGGWALMVTVFGGLSGVTALSLGLTNRAIRRAEKTQREVS